jgi:hypothetical protein
MFMDGIMQGNADVTQPQSDISIPVQSCHYLETRGKPMKMSGYINLIQTRYSPNTNPEHYCYSNMIGLSGQMLLLVK